MPNWHSPTVASRPSNVRGLVDSGAAGTTVPASGSRSSNRRTVTVVACGAACSPKMRFASAVFVHVGASNIWMATGVDPAASGTVTVNR